MTAWLILIAVVTKPISIEGVDYIFTFFIMAVREAIRIRIYPISHSVNPFMQSLYKLFSFMVPTL